MTSETVRRQIEQCLVFFREGSLEEDDLQRLLDTLDGAVLRRQDLLYLQTVGTSLHASVVGMALLQDGELTEGPAGADEWPYPNVLSAIRDGWRVIQFPNMAVLLDESRTVGLGCEFILERWS